ncbi:Hypothetical predicted protein [Paramuricea clavata]|uniref:Mutator-like transposase domain-containing protein n=1 Tax=Paramuricea clavata TaxID=317549 RepID=A0A7D9E7D2_PARCT|nr:Hypothetical predicted protein [Paramuricea clavata]
MIGKGHAGASKVCSVMNMPPPPRPKSFGKSSCVITKHANTVAKKSMRAATKEVCVLQQSEDVDGTNPVNCGSVSTHGDFDECPEIDNIRKLISATRTEVTSINAKIDEHLSCEDIKRDIVKTLMCKQVSLQNRVEELYNILTGLFQKEATRLSAQQSHCVSLHSEEARKLNEELDKFIQILNFNIESRSDFTGMIAGLTDNVKESCPPLFDILEAISLHKDGRPVSNMRVKSAVHAIAILVSLKNQKIKNDFN